MRLQYEVKDIDIENDFIHKALFGIETANLLVSLLTLPKKDGKTEAEVQEAMKKLVISNVAGVLNGLEDRNLMLVPKEQIPDAFKNA